MEIEERGQELLAQISRAASGYTVEDVLNASTSLFLNVLRRSCPDRASAQRTYDEIVERLRETLLERYEQPVFGVTGKPNGPSPTILSPGPVSSGTRIRRPVAKKKPH